MAKNSYTITVTVSDSDTHDGTLKVAVDAPQGTVVRGNNTDAATVSYLDFTNTCDATGSLTLAGDKTLKGRAMAANEFAFEVQEVDDQGSAIEGKKWTASNAAAAAGQPGAIDYPTIPYTLADSGTHHYVVTETSTGGSGVTVATNRYAVTVTVSDSEAHDGTLKVTASGVREKTGESDQSLSEVTGVTPTLYGLDFVNEYRATGTLTLSGTKTLTGRAMTANEFGFEVMEVKGGVETAVPGTVTHLGAASGVAAAITYPKIEFVRDGSGRDDRGLHTYKVRETTQSDNGVNVDTRAYTVTVNVADDGKGNLTATPIEGSDPTNALNFSNTYTAVGTATISGTKTIVDRNFKTGDMVLVTIEADASTPDAPLPRNTTVSVTAASAGTGDQANVAGFRFGDIAYDLEAMKVNGEYVKERIFTYTAAGETTLSGTKTIENRGFTSGDKWTFTVTAKDANAPLPNPATVTIEPTSGNTAVIDFGKIKYTEADIGHTYAYIIAETGSGKGVTNDPNPKTVTVKVEDNGNGTLKVTDSWSTGIDEAAAVPLTFTNTYHAAVETELTATKIIKNRTFQSNDTWTFDVTAKDTTDTEDVTKKDDSEVPKPANMNVTIDPTIGTERTFSFGSIAYDETDIGHTYTYTIAETGNVAGVENDTGEHWVRVTVTENNGDLELEKTYSDTTGAVFTNTYSAEAEASLAFEGTKTIVNRAFAEGDRLKVSVSAENGGRLPAPAEINVNLTAGNSARFRFADIQYTLQDLWDEKTKSYLDEKTFVYTFTESFTDSTGGYTKPDGKSHTVSVTVRDLKSGK